MNIENPPPSNLSLAVDIGSITTRCMLFDPIDDRYHLIGIGKAPTTLGLYGEDVRLGLRLALEELQANTGKIFLDGQKQLIQPVSRDGDGVALAVATVSAGPPLKLLLVSLSKTAANPILDKLTRSTYTGQVKSLSMIDDIEPAALIDAILVFKSDIVMIVGSTDKGNQSAILRFLEPVRIALKLLPEILQPEILFIGNGKQKTVVQSLFENSPRFHPMACDSLDLEGELLERAREILAKITINIRLRQIPGLKEVQEVVNGNLYPTYWGFFRALRILNKGLPAQKGVTGIDIGFKTAIFIGCYAEDVSLGIYPMNDWPGEEDLLPEFTDRLKSQKSLVSNGLSQESVEEYYYNHLLYPLSLPVSKSEKDITAEINRIILNSIVERQRKDFPVGMQTSEGGFITWGEPILVSGSALTNSDSLSQSCLALLDSMQPVGITTIVTDIHQAGASLGILASFNSSTSPHLLDFNLFLHLATVINPVGRSSTGTPILRVKITIDDGAECVMDVRQGDLEVIPLAPGKNANLQLQPFHRYDIGMGGAGRGGRVRVSGSVLGIIIDARGRPLIFPDDQEQRKASYRKSLWMLGG